MDVKLIKQLVSDAIANANYKRMAATGKAADEARERLEQLKALRDSIDKGGLGGFSTDVTDDILVHVDIPFSCVPLLLEILDKAVAECDNTVEGKRKQKKLIDIQITLMGGKNELDGQNGKI